LGLPWGRFALALCTINGCKLPVSVYLEVESQYQTLKASRPIVGAGTSGVNKAKKRALSPVKLTRLLGGRGIVDEDLDSLEAVLMRVMAKDGQRRSQT
jgi:hypothetical protein